MYLCAYSEYDSVHGARSLLRYMRRMVVIRVSVGGGLMPSALSQACVNGYIEIPQQLLLIVQDELGTASRSKVVVLYFCHSELNPLKTCYIS